jgi:L-alanine-DL-glutamate epimerase-like enolase superfamily enzyme
MSNSTRIESIRLFEAASPLSKPIADSTHQIPEIRFLVVRLRLHDGTTGEGYLLAFHYSQQASIGALRDVASAVVGRDTSATAAFNSDCEREHEYFGVIGLLRWAQAVVNLAMWDAWGRHLGQPVSRLLGAHSDRVRVYGSGGWLSYSDDELIDEVCRYKERGFAAVKIKVGSPDPERDVERVAKVREAVGDSVQIMIDANQGLNYPAALALANHLRDFRIHWFEEPLPRTDYDGYQALRQNGGIALAMGEREFDLVGLRELAARRALDLWQPDIVRLGGVEGWRDSAAAARVHHLPVLPHYYKEYDVPLCCTIPNAYGVESFDWVDPVIDHPVEIRDGYAYPSERSGWGFSFREEALKEISL